MTRQFRRQGYYLRTLRTESGLTQKQLGKKMGIHAQFISNAERGVSALPITYLKKIKLGMYGFHTEAYIGAAILDAADGIESYLRNSLK
jgi:transcriptional regulator with XRE-family HTH domain